MPLCVNDLKGLFIDLLVFVKPMFTDTTVNSQGLESAIQFELWNHFQTGNVVIDSIVRSLLLAFIVGMVTSIMGLVKDDVLYPIAEKVKSLITRTATKTRKYIVTLEGHSKTSVHMCERYIFSIEFKAVLDAILNRKFITDVDDVRSLSQFHNGMDIKYDRWSNDETREYSYSYILNQTTEVMLTDGLYAKVIVEKQDQATNEKATKVVESKVYKVTLGSNTMKCEDIVKWIEETTTNYSQIRANILNSKRYLAKFRGCEKHDDGGRADWDIDVLTCEPTFDSLFFEGKEQFVKTIQRFLDERKFYESVGKPWQLGINLSGPPGCGKTSFIRVIASMLNRNIKDISFSKIKTNKDFEEAIRCVEYEGKQLSPEKTIIVAEDIDCANMEVIRTRSNSHSTDEASSHKNETESNCEKDDGGMKTLVNAINEANRIERAAYVKTEKEMLKESDALDLSTILNIMDGIRSSHGRIIILTTNHPEKIDPALLRPGRIDLDIRFGELSAKLVYEMCYYWYSKYSDFYDDVSILERFVNGWKETCEGHIRDGVIRPCVVHNILQKNGKNIEEALVDLRFACV